MNITDDEYKDKKELERSKDDNYHSTLYDGSNIENFFKESITSSPVKKAAPEIQIPDIKGEDDLSLEAPVIEPLEGNVVDLGAEKNSPEIMAKLEKILSELGDVSLELKLKDLKKEILSEMEESLLAIKKEIDDFKEKKVPKRKYYDTGGAYREDLYVLATKVLDNTLIDLFEELPDYSLLANQITKVFDDGTAANGIIAINVTINREGYRYDFKVDVPLLNGILQSPQYLERGNKIIPLTSEAVYEEMESLAFRKVNIDDMTSKKNTFNNTGENLLRRPDTQKNYHVNDNMSSNSSLPSDHTWVTEKMKGQR